MRAKIKVAFIVNNAATWDSLHTVYMRMVQKESGFVPRVFVIPCDHASIGQYGGEDTTYTEMLKLGVRTVHPKRKTMGEFLDVIKAFAPDYVFRQAPWENHLPPEFRVWNLDFARLCYIPYGFLSANIEHEQFNQAYHRACWGIFCETRLHRLLYEKNSPLGSRNVVVTGFPKFETLWERRSEQFWPTTTRSGDIKIIWAPHHSVTPQWLGFSTFVDNHMLFYNLARSNPHLHIVLRPHPALFAKLRAHGVPQEHIDKFIADFTALPNAALYEDGDFIPLFGASDILITDGIGFFSEYMLTGKPIIHTDSGRSVGFNPAGELLTPGLYRAQNFDEAISTLVHLAKGHDPLHETRLAIAKILFDPHRIPPSKLIVNILSDAMQEN